MNQNRHVLKVKILGEKTHFTEAYNFFSRIRKLWRNKKCDCYIPRVSYVDNTQQESLHYQWVYIPAVLPKSVIGQWAVTTKELKGRESLLYNSLWRSFSFLIYKEISFETQQGVLNLHKTLFMLRKCCNPILKSTCNIRF